MDSAELSRYQRPSISTEDLSDQEGETTELKKPARIAKYIKEMASKQKDRDWENAIDAQLEALEEEKVDNALVGVIPKDLSQYTQDGIEDLYKSTKNNENFNIVSAEGRGPTKLMEMAAKYPKSSALTSFTFGTNYELRAAKEQLPLNTRSMMSKIATWGKSNKFTRIKDLCINYKPLISSHSKFVGKTSFMLVDSRKKGQSSIIRTATTSSNLDTSIYMSMDYFVPTRDFGKVSLYIGCTFTGVNQGEMYASVWLHGNLEHTNNNYQTAVVATHGCINIPTNALLTKGSRDPTRFNGFISAKALGEFRQQYARFEDHRSNQVEGSGRISDLYYDEDRKDDLPLYEASDEMERPEIHRTKPLRTVQEEFTLGTDELREARIKYPMYEPIQPTSFKRGRPKTQPYQRLRRESGYTSSV